MSKGGHPSDIENIQLAHMCCNRQKSDKLSTKVEYAQQKDPISNRNCRRATTGRTCDGCPTRTAGAAGLGIKCYISRVAAPGCCEWCSDVAGRYVYGDQPDDIFRRHDNCDCTVTFENGRQRQDVWSKRTWEAPEEGAGAGGLNSVTPEQAAQKQVEMKLHVLTNASGHGIITVEADEFVPCLKDAKTGALLETEVKKVAESASISDCTLANGWDFPWNEAPKDCDVYSLHVKGSNNIEGLVALRSDDAAWGVYMQWGNAAPHNQGQNKKYIGVGGHLFAIAAKVSIEKGYGGFIFADAANEELFRLFVDKYGATPFSTRIRPYRFGFEGEALLNILNTYNFDWGE